MSFTGGDAFVERVVRIPFPQDVCGQSGQVETFVLFEFHISVIFRNYTFFIRPPCPLRVFSRRSHSAC